MDSKLRRQTRASMRRDSTSNHVRLLLGAVCVAQLSQACGFSRDVEGKVTLSQGVYGQITTGTDTGSSDDMYLPGVPVSLLSEDGTQTLTATTSDDQGFYQVRATVGMHQICGIVLQETWCQTFYIPSGLRRIDAKFTRTLFWYPPDNSNVLPDGGTE